MRRVPYVERRLVNTQIISHLLARQPAGQRNAHRILA